MEETFADWTTMRVGGPANKIEVANTREELINKTVSLIESGEDWMPLGGGSNTIVSDEGFPGTVLLIRTSGITEIPDEKLTDKQIRIRVEAGHDWDDLVQHCINNGFIGLEALAGIPGAVGAAPIQNIGAYGTEIKQTLHSIELLETDTAEIDRFYAADLDFAYRDSALKRQELTGVVVTVDFVLDRAQTTEMATTTVKHEQLAKALKCQIGDRVALHEIRESVLQLRNSKGMVLNDSDHDTWSSGSFFMNPIVSTRFARTLPPNAPRYPLEEKNDTPTVIPLTQLHLIDELKPLQTAENFTKVSAAWLIENSGIKKGFRLPGSGAAISNKHTLAITNRGRATANDVAELARYVISRVRSEFGVLLVPEPNIYGLML